MSLHQQNLLGWLHSTISSAVCYSVLSVPIFNWWRRTPCQDLGLVISAGCHNIIDNGAEQQIYIYVCAHIYIYTYECLKCGKAIHLWSLFVKDSFSNPASPQKALHMQSERFRIASVASKSVRMQAASPQSPVMRCLLYYM